MSHPSPVHGHFWAPQEGPHCGCALLLLGSWPSHVTRTLPHGGPQPRCPCCPCLFLLWGQRGLGSPLLHPDRAPGTGISWPFHFCPQTPIHDKAGPSYLGHKDHALPVPQVTPPTPGAVPVASVPCDREQVSPASVQSLSHGRDEETSCWALPPWRGLAPSPPLGPCGGHGETLTWAPHCGCTPTAAPPTAARTSPASPRRTPRRPCPACRLQGQSWP